MFFSLYLKVAEEVTTEEKPSKSEEDHLWCQRSRNVGMERMKRLNEKIHAGVSSQNRTGAVKRLNEKIHAGVSSQNRTGAEGKKENEKKANNQNYK